MRVGLMFGVSVALTSLVGILPAHAASIHFSDPGAKVSYSVDNTTAARNVIAIGWCGLLETCFLSVGSRTFLPFVVPVSITFPGQTPTPIEFLPQTLYIVEQDNHVSDKLNISLNLFINSYDVIFQSDLGSSSLGAVPPGAPFVVEKGRSQLGATVTWSDQSVDKISFTSDLGTASLASLTSFDTQVLVDTMPEPAPVLSVGTGIVLLAVAVIRRKRLS